MKKNKKVNPLTHFNNLKAAAVKKAGKDMSAYKKSLKKAQAGIQTNSSNPASMASSDVRNAAMDSANKINMANEQYNSGLAARKPMEDSYKKADRAATSKSLLDSYKLDPSTGKMIDMGRQRKGGSVKKMSKGGALKPVPSDKVGLSKLPTPVRNKMGYQKKGGSVKRK
jgi:hypothetical protein